MKTIGLIGGLSWESSAEYYRIINETTRDRLGGLYSAQTLMYSLNFAEVERHQHAGAWDKATELMLDAAERLERRGTLVSLTSAGKKLTDEVVETHLATEREFLSSLTEKQKADLATLLGQLAQAVGL